MRILKWVGLVLLLVLVVTAVLLVRTWQTPPADRPTAHVFKPLPIDHDAALQRFSGAVKLHTVSTASAQPDAADLQAFHDYIEQQFPLVQQHLKREILDSGALLYTWQGSDASRKPIILMAHQDTVPIESGTRDKWTREPFSGDIADGMIWGRGSLDDKASLVSILEATEILLGQGFVPKRTIYFAFGEDEERGGGQGASSIVALLKQRGVHAAFVLDEGGAITQGLIAGVDGDLALVGIAEKGYLTFTLTVNAAGGHSSQPPPQTAIGILGRALGRLDSQRMPARLTPPVAHLFDAIAGLVPFSARLAIRNRWLLEPLLLDALRKSPSSNSMIRTTTAETIVKAGFKDNVLPAEAVATVNFRLLPGDTLDTVAAHIRAVVDDPRVVIEPDRSDYRPASPVSPVDGEGFKLLRETIGDIAPGVPLAPYMVTAGTDSGLYGPVSDAQLRFVPYTFNPQSITRFHGINEAISVEDYLRCVRFVARLIDNAAGPASQPAG